MMGDLPTEGGPVDAGAGESSDPFTLPTEFNTMGDLDGVEIPGEASPPETPPSEEAAPAVQTRAPASPPTPSRAAPPQPGAPAAPKTAQPTQAPGTQSPQQP